MKLPLISVLVACWIQLVVGGVPTAGTCGTLCGDGAAAKYQCIADAVCACSGKVMGAVARCIGRTCPNEDVGRDYAAYAYQCAYYQVSPGLSRAQFIAEAQSAEISVSQGGGPEPTDVPPTPSPTPESTSSTTSSSTSPSSPRVSGPTPTDRPSGGTPGSGSGGSSSPSSSSSSPNIGLIVGIAVAVVAFLAILLALCLYCCWRRKQRPDKDNRSHGQSELRPMHTAAGSSVQSWRDGVPPGRPPPEWMSVSGYGSQRDTGSYYGTARSASEWRYG